MAGEQYNDRAKPSKDFPLYRHARGYWAKKAMGKVWYFGKIKDDPDGKQAILAWVGQKDIILAGRDPRDYKAGEPTVSAICNHFLKAKEGLIGQIISLESWKDYKKTAERLTRVFKRHTPVALLRSEDFNTLHADISASYGIHRIATEIQRVRTIFNWAKKNDHIEHAVNFGSDFKKPPKRAFRIHKRSVNRLIEAADIRRLLKSAKPNIKAMILLAINAGFGNDDCCQLPRSAINFKSRLLTWYRPKTGIERAAVLWPETIDAISESIAESSFESELVFVTKYGNQWTSNAVRIQFERLSESLGLRRRGFSFYSLRHTFKTIGEESGDESGTEFVMGHIDADAMSENYRIRFNEDRLKKISTYVHKWLFGKKRKNA